MNDYNFCLKRAVWLRGLDAIEDLVGHQINPNITAMELEKCIDEALANMPEDCVDQFLQKYYQPEDDNAFCFFPSKRTFVVTKKTWYDRVKNIESYPSIILGFTMDDGSTEGEFEIEWNPTGVLVKVFDDAWEALYRMPDLMTAMAKFSKRKNQVTIEEFTDMLKHLGFRDETVWDYSRKASDKSDNGIDLPTPKKNHRANLCVPSKTEPRIHIISRNVDGIRVEHAFIDIDTMLADWNSDEPSMGDNQILFVSLDGAVIFSSLGREETKYEDTVRASDVMEWFSN